MNHDASLEPRASCAEASAKSTCAELVGAISAAEVLIEQTEVRARVTQLAIEQAELAQERVAKALALAQQRIDEAEAIANQALERAQTAESEFGAAQARVSNAEERSEILTTLLRRRLSLAAPTPSSSDTPNITPRKRH